MGLHCNPRASLDFVKIDNRIDFLSDAFDDTSGNKRKNLIKDISRMKGCLVIWRTYLLYASKAMRVLQLQHGISKLKNSNRKSSQRPPNTTANGFSGWHICSSSQLFQRPSYILNLLQRSAHTFECLCIVGLKQDRDSFLPLADRVKIDRRAQEHLPQFDLPLRSACEGMKQTID